MKKKIAEKLRTWYLEHRFCDGTWNKPRTTEGKLMTWRQALKRREERAA